MTGGKRLTEEERVEWFGFVHAQNKRVTTPERRLVICKEIIDDLEAWLERDDDPEYCTCGAEHDTFADVVNDAPIKRCYSCGKPVK